MAARRHTHRRNNSRRRRYWHFSLRDPHGDACFPAVGVFDIASAVKVDSAGTLTFNGGYWTASGTVDGTLTFSNSSTNIATRIDASKFD